MQNKKTYKPLDELLETSGLKMEVIAERMGISYDVFYKLRKRPDTISAIRLGKMSKATGVDFLQLMKVVKKFEEELDKLKSVS
jgi:transcriptional regulator with XRE-family HTH domain